MAFGIGQMDFDNKSELCAKTYMRLWQMTVGVLLRLGLVTLVLGCKVLPYKRLSSCTVRHSLYGLEYVDDSQRIAPIQHFIKIHSAVLQIVA
jgi:hypothetical protein